MKLNYYFLPLFLFSCSNSDLEFCKNRETVYEYKANNGDISRYRFDIIQEKFVLFGHHKMLDEPEWGEVSLDTEINNDYFIVGGISIPKNLFEENRWSQNGVVCNKVSENSNKFYIKCSNNKYSGKIRYVYEIKKGVISIEEYYKGGAIIKHELLSKFGLGYFC